ncbi:histidinol-phosphate transaminase [bacterium]|nr:histidinol-phosphate transaminase [bacterium]
MTENNSRLNVPSNILKIEPYLPGKPEEELMRELGLTHVMKMASNENCFGPSPAALEVMKTSLEKVHRYPDGNAYYLKKALSEKLGVQPEKIILGNGSTDLIEIIARTYLEPTSNTVTADQTFLMYRVVTVGMNAECKTVPLRNFTFDLPAILNAIDDHARLVYIANPNNPTGTIVKRNALESFLKQVPSGVLVVLDEAYFDYVEDPNYASGLEFLDRFENIIVLRTFSKIHGLAGIRIGYAIATEEIIKNLNRIRPPFNTSSVAQAAAIAALSDVNYINFSKQTNREQRELLQNKLRELNISFVPSTTNFVLIPLSDAERIFKELLIRGIIVRSMRSLSCDDGLRVTIGKPEENRAFLEAFQAVL